ncbi:MAG: hypothetical protein IJ984_07815, partial [Prevotella sp.]|nr:hypothetical protein [Prevotella sp.]
MKIRNAYQIKFVAVALALMALGWLLGSRFFDDSTLLFSGVVIVAAIVLICYLVRMANFVPAQVNHFLSSLLCKDYMI